MQFKCLFFALITVFICGSFTDETDLITARVYYQKGSNDKVAAQNLRSLTETKSSQPIFKAYNGVAYALLAKHHWNPYKKLELVNKGIEIINSAVLLNTNEIEIRFLRYSVEENLPAIISFNSHIQEDKKYILSNLNSSHSFYSTMKTYLKTSKNLTQAEKIKL